MAMAMGESLPALISRRYQELGFRSLNAFHEQRLSSYFTSQAFYRIMNGITKRPRAHTITGLSDALEVSENEIRAALLVPPTLEEWSPRGADVLDAKQRQAVAMVINEFARANRRAVHDES